MGTAVNSWEVNQFLALQELEALESSPASLSEILDYLKKNWQLSKVQQRTAAHWPLSLRFDLCHWGLTFVTEVWPLSLRFDLCHWGCSKGTNSWEFVPGDSECGQTAWSLHRLGSLSGSLLPGYRVGILSMCYHLVLPVLSLFQDSITMHHDSILQGGSEVSWKRFKKGIESMNAR